MPGTQQALCWVQGCFSDGGRWGEGWEAANSLESLVQGYGKTKCPGVAGGDFGQCQRGHRALAGTLSWMPPHNPHCSNAPYLLRLELVAPYRSLLAFLLKPWPAEQKI